MREPTYKTWKTREAMAKALRRQEMRSASNEDWTPVESLLAHEGFEY